MCSVLLGQHDPTMHAMLEMTEDWDSNKSNLLFALKAAEVACIGVQENFSHMLRHVRPYTPLQTVFKTVKSHSPSNGPS